MTATAPSASATATLHHLQDLQYMASRTEGQIAAVRASVQSAVAWRNRVFQTVPWLLVAASVGLLAGLPLVGPSAAILGGTVIALLAGLAGLALFNALTRADQQLDHLLRPLHAEECLQALELVQSFAACEQYRARVLAHPRQFVVADMAILRQLAARERDATAAYAHRNACAMLHQLNTPTP